jgi:hypothetical protein
MEIMKLNGNLNSENANKKKKKTKIFLNKEESEEYKNIEMHKIKLINDEQMNIY